MPHNNENNAIGSPAFKYSANERLTPLFFADSATIKLATEPNNVTFPARVLDIASTNHALCGSIKLGIIGKYNNTAGTFDIKLLKTTDIKLKLATLSQDKGFNKLKNRLPKPV